MINCFRNGMFILPNELNIRSFWASPGENENILEPIYRLPYLCTWQE